MIEKDSIMLAAAQDERDVDIIHNAVLKISGETEMITHSGKKMPVIKRAIGLRLNNRDVILEEENHVMVRIADTGCGIAGKDLTRIYNPFFYHRDIPSFKHPLKNFLKK